MVDVQAVSNNQLLLLDPAAPLGGWQIVFLLGTGVFAAGSLATYFNFWPLSVINRFRTDLWRNKYLSPSQIRLNKALSFVAFGAGSLVFLGVWVGSVGQSYRTILDHDRKVIMRESLFLGDRTQTASLPLDQLKEAKLEFGRGNSARLVFVMKDGSVFIPLSTGFGEGEGLARVVEKINGFLRTEKF